MPSTDAAPAESTATDARFEDVNWEQVRVGVPLVSRHTVVTVAAVALWVAVVAYDFFVVGARGYIFRDIDVSALDWLFILSVILFFFLLVVPLVRRPRVTVRYWKQLRQRPVALVSLAYLLVFSTLGVAVPAIYGRVDLNPALPYNPPVGFSVMSSVAYNCVGEVSNFQCHGGLAHPLGTAELGKDVGMLIISGMRVAVRVALVTSMLIIPLATVVGAAAGYVGGRTDDVLTRVIDVVQLTPAFLVYLIFAFLFGRSLFLIVLVFGLLNWGGIARLVRSETLKRREESYVKAARAAGASRLQVLRRHLMPNVSNTVLTATTRQIPMIIIAEAALSFMQWGDVQYYSWGQTIGVAFRRQQQLAYSNIPVSLWWIWGLPVLFIVLTAVAFAVFGDSLQDVLDPRAEV